jgi:hypothetical protein
VAHTCNPSRDQEAEIRKSTVRSQTEQIVPEVLSRKTLHKKGLVEWLRVKAPSSNPSTTIINKIKL